MKTRLEFEGYKFDWFATDADGRLALFSSAGWGPVPNFVFENFDGQEAIEQHIARLAGIKPPLPQPDWFQPFLDFGLFVYDWHDTYGPYRNCGVPLDAKSIEQLVPFDLQSSLVALPTIQFCLTAELLMQDIPAFTDISRR